MSAKFSFCTVMWFALLVARYESGPLSVRKGLNNLLERRHPSTVPRREPNINERWASRGEIRAQEEYGVVAGSQNIRSIDFRSITSRLAEPEEDDYSNCGKVSKRFKRIVGGRDSHFGNHPWQVALFKPELPEKPYCGGVLINDRSIITAAHCVKKRSNIKALRIRLGEHNVLDAEEELPYEIYKVEQAEIHPNYSDIGKPNDIAILKLDRTVRFNEHIVPACLTPGNLDLIGQKAVVAGWGNKIFNDPKSASPILNEVEVEVIANEVCQRWILEENYKVSINDGQLCAGYKVGGRDACTGDSGGALTISVDDRRVLIGIVSTGISCGEKNLPGMYVNVEKYLPWIKATLKWGQKEGRSTLRNWFRMTDNYIR